jgi:hypothetical protein
MSILNGFGHESTRLEQVKAAVANAIDQLQHKPLATKAKASILEHPLAAAGVALGVGFLFVQLVRKASS